MEVWEEHDVLYHYATSSGLAGILESQTLHATHYKYMNDTSEVVHMAPKLKEIIKPGVRNAVANWAKKNERLSRFIESQGGIDKLIETEGGKMIDILYRVTFGDDRPHKFLQPFFVCFCKHGKETYERESGLLSQWRAYGRDAGYAIAFDVKRLVNMLKSEAERYFVGHGAFGDVVFADQDDKFNNEFEALIQLATEFFPKMATGEIPEFGKTLRTVC